MNNEIIRGITEVDPSLHVAISDYPALAPTGGEEKGVHVIEITNGPAAHLEDRLLCFGRWITAGELERRIELHATDPELYQRDHLVSLNR